MIFDYFQNPNGSRLSGLFTESGVAGMLQAEKSENIDKTLPFPGALVVFNCKQWNCADTTGTITKHIGFIWTL